MILSLALRFVILYLTYFVFATHANAPCHDGKICMSDAKRFVKRNQIIVKWFVMKSVVITSNKSHTFFAKRSVYYFPSQKQLTLPCDGIIKSGNDSFNATLTIRWTWQSFFGPAPKRLANWNETVEVWAWHGQRGRMMSPWHLTALIQFCCRDFR